MTNSYLMHKLEIHIAAINPNKAGLGKDPRFPAIETVDGYSILRAFYAHTVQKSTDGLLVTAYFYHMIVINLN